MIELCVCSVCFPLPHGQIQLEEKGTYVKAVPSFNMLMFCVLGISAKMYIIFKMVASFKDEKEEEKEK